MDLELRTKYEDCLKISKKIRGKLKSNEGFTHAKIDHIFCTLRAFYQVTLHREKIKKLHIENPGIAVSSYMYRNTGLIIHRENLLSLDPKKGQMKNDFQILDNAPELLFNTFLDMAEKISVN